MHNTWFISDTHFGHTAILDFEPFARPFSSLEEMHEAMIERWNSVVKPKDIVYHLGDFCFGRANIAIARRLNGRKRLILGNHDHYPAADYLQYFDKLYGAFNWKNCILTHIPVHINNLGARFFLNIHGHLHSHRVRLLLDKYGDTETWIDDLNYMNVSCEQNNLKPIHADMVMERLKLMERS